jgi:hypothetical protein
VRVSIRRITTLLVTAASFDTSAEEPYALMVAGQASWAVRLRAVLANTGPCEIADMDAAGRATCGQLGRCVHLGDDPGVAQLGEQRTVHSEDAGSNPASGVQDSEGPPHGGPSTCNELSKRIVALVLRRIAGAVLRTSRIRDAGPGVELLERRRPVVAPVPVGRVRVPG